MMTTIKGFTLVELLIALATLSCLLALGTPLLNSIMAKNRAATEINRLVEAIQLARHQAIKHHALTTVCPSLDGHNCNGSWNDGMIVFVDKKGNARFETEDILIRVYDKLDSGKLYWNSLHTNYLQMSPSGYLKGQNGTFLYCPNNKDSHFARAIIISQTGRIRLSSANKNGIHEDAEGNPLHC